MDRLRNQEYDKLLGHDPNGVRRNNLDPSLLPEEDDFEVKTTIVIDTTRGMIELPVTASSKRVNSYAVPDTIQFRHPEYESKLNVDDSSRVSLKGDPNIRHPPNPFAILLETMNFNNHGENGESASPGLAEPQRDCYDLFLSNPSPSEELEISEVLISSPEMLTVEFDPQRLLLSQDIPMYTTEPSQAIRQWTEDGPLFLPPDSIDNYVVTICTSSNDDAHHDDENYEINLEEMGIRIESASSEQSLGFLQVTMNEESLFIGLERAPAEPTSIQDLSREGEEDIASKSESESSSLLIATPEEAEFHFMSSQQRTMTSKIQLLNKSPAPIRIMRVTTGVANDDANVEVGLELLGLHVNASFEALGPSLDPLVLDPGDGSAGSVVISSEVKRGIVGLPIAALHFTGAVIIRGTMDTDHNFDQWRNELVQNPLHDVHLVLEIPFSVTVVNGRIDLMIERSTHPYPQIFSAPPWDKTGRIISALHFPLSRLEASDGSENPLPTQNYQDAKEVVHDLLVASSNKAMSLTLDGAEVLTEEGEVNSESVCNRFNVSVVKQFKPSSRKASDLKELGYLSVHYKFEENGGVRRRKMREPDETDWIHATTCYLNVITSPEYVGFQRVPLIIFPGHLEISTPNSVSDASPELDSPDNTQQGNGPTATGMSFLGMLTWLRSSVVGKSLIDVIGSVSEDRGLKGFRKFLRTICRHSPIVDDDSKLKPILLKIGAIEHSEIAQTPLFLTNHNPVPITVQIDVGEVEGMSIVVGRDASQGAGDGNNMLDYFPRSLGLKQVVNSGRHQGQPLDGLRQFLLSNDKSIAFASRFPFRDAVSMNKAATSKEPLLEPLYKLYSYAKFHRGQLSERSLSSTATSTVSPPLYESFEAQASKPHYAQLQGPIIVSGDKTLARSLNVVRQNLTSSHDSGSNVLIPPGATARFEVRVRAPPAGYLRNDISQVISTGLVLSTNFGNIMPIFATFEALQGQLHVSQVGTVLPWDGEAPGFGTPAKEDGSIIPVPLGLYWKSPDLEDGTQKSPLTIPPGQTELQRRTFIINGTATDGTDAVSLHLTSTFSREVRLLQLESCNPWFQFVLQELDGESHSHSDRGVNVGLLYSTVSCAAEGVIGLRYPSFYQCAMNWLADRSDLQPPGCGRMPVFQKRKLDDKSGVDASHSGVGRVRTAFERVLSLLNEAYSDDDQVLESNKTSMFPGRSSNHQRNLIAIKSGRRRSNGIVSLSLLNSFAEAWDAWRIASDFGLGLLSSNLRARIEYETFSGERKLLPSMANRRSLSLSIHNLTIESVLRAPKLFKPQLGPGLPDLGRDTQGPAVVDFSPTAVGAVASMTIPLRNPTSVPIRVRLGSAPSSNKPAQSIEHAAEDWIRNRFLQNLASPYVQNGKPESGGSNHHLWWNGGGLFYMGDGRGDYIRSNHNITIKAGAGAHVSLVNPSLHSNSAFVIGCGQRCGIRTGNAKKAKDYTGPEMSSPIGAAAAAGITLLGRKRYPLPQANTMATDEPNVIAGGVAGDSGPAAFAIPYSSLDEIVIPPFGEAEIGPVYFRPPGRFGVLGCSLAQESEATHWGLQTRSLCESEVFESMIFLENSLTGLERLVLRGKNVHGRLYFLDPFPEEGQDAFGDIEFRSGRSTLIFPGSSERQSYHHGKGGPSPVVKEVLLHNGGDVGVEIGVIYLADNSKLLHKKWPYHGVASSACKFGSFRLFDCYESNQSKFLGDHGGSFENIHAGFELAPGENRSLFIEHLPDCTKQDEFISLNVEYSYSNSQFIPNETGRTRMKERSGDRRQKIDLSIGYRMSESELTRCVPVGSGAFNSVVRPNKAGSANKNVTDSLADAVSFHEFKFRGERTSTIASLYEGTFTRICDCFLLLAAFALLAFSWTTMPQAVESIWFKFGASARPKAMTKSTTPKSAQVSKTRWFPLFRCLARADPTAAELQTLGREQIRQVVIGRYRSKGTIPPHSLTSSSFLTRERTSKIAISSAQGKEVGTGNDRARTLSDTLFQNVSAEDDNMAKFVLPLGLGWRTAYSRGIINDSSIEDSDLVLKTKQLMLTRNSAGEDDPTDLSTGTDQYQQHGPTENDAETSEENDTLGDRSESSSLDSLDARNHATAEEFSIVAGHERTHGAHDTTDGEQLKHAHSGESDSNLDEEKRQHNEVDTVDQDGKACDATSNRDEVGRPHENLISGIESLVQQDSGGRTGDDERQHVVAEGSTDTIPADKKGVWNSISGEGRNKRNGGKIDAKEPSGSSTSKEDEKHPNKIDFGDKQREITIHQGFQTSSTHEKGKSQNHQAWGTRPVQKRAGAERSKSRMEKVVKSERRKAKKASTEGPSKKKGKSKAKNQSQATPDDPSSMAANQPEPFGVSNKGPTAENSTDTGLRPPPGLAPPPGFLAEATPVEASTAPDQATELGPILSSLLPHNEVGFGRSSQPSTLSFLQPGAPGNDNLMFSGHGSSIARNTESVFPVHASQNIAGLGQPSLPSPTQSRGFESQINTPMNPASFQSQNNGFDVMDFLDSILNESTPELNVQSLETNGPLLPGSSPILSNPWASEGQSRAAAYGISFEKPESDDLSDAEPMVHHAGIAAPVEDRSMVGNIPLLTPAAILYSDQEQQRDNASTDDEEGFAQSWMVSD
eukprot:scaffold1736_cov127-Cylindrotheca_fusiformis.AAC.118